MSTFISYSRADSSFAVRLAKDLKSAGYDVWLDQLDIPTGARWDDEVEVALESCKTFMIVLSPESLQSQNVKDEIGYAIDSGKNILPVKIKPGDIPFRLRRFQYVDFTNKPYQESLKEIKSILPPREQFLTTRQIEKRLAWMEAPSPTEELEQQKRDPLAQPKGDQGAESQARSPLPVKKPVGRRLLLGVVTALVAVAVGTIIMSVILSKEASVSTTPTSAFVMESPAAETPTSKPAGVIAQVAFTPTVQSEVFTTDFAQMSDLDGWERIVKGTGRASQITVSSAKDGLIFDLDDPDIRAYYVYPKVYTDVALRVKAENLGKSAFGIGLLCRRTENSWYEFRITGYGLWYLYKYEAGYLPLDNGGTTALKAGKSINEYEMLCADDQISLRINGETLTTFRFRTSFYQEGQVGFDILSPQDVFPIDIKMMHFEVSRP